MKQLNQELGELTHQRKSCRFNTGLYGALGGIILALSTLGGFHSLLNSHGDWSHNPNSPVHELATINQDRFKLPIPVIIVGFMLGLGLFYRARTTCSDRERLWSEEWNLIHEMRALRDKMYPKDTHKHGKGYAPPQPVEHTTPLNPDEVRGEYVGVYSPPGHHRDKSSH